MVYGYSNTTGFSPIIFGRGFYVRPVTNSSLEPIAVSGWLHPTIFGSRVIAHSGSDVVLQDPSTTYESHFEDWLTTTPGGALTVDRSDAAANGQLIALEFENYRDRGQDPAARHRRRHRWRAGQPARDRLLLARVRSGG